MINALARKAYLKAEISMLEKDIRALEVFIQAYEEPSYENVLSRLHERYRKYDMAKRDQDDWSSQQYHRSTYMPQQKNHTTSHGLKVRSKSEMLIAEKLYERRLRSGFYHPPLRRKHSVLGALWAYREQSLYESSLAKNADICRSRHYTLEKPHHYL